jgi:hypothetical protein
LEPIQPSLLDLLKVMVEKNASDLHVTTGSPPVLRVDDQLIPLRRCAVLTPTDTQKLCYSILTEDQRRQFEASCELVGMVEDLLDRSGHGTHLRNFVRAGMAWTMNVTPSPTTTPTSSSRPPSSAPTSMVRPSSSRTRTG